MKYLTIRFFREKRRCLIMLRAIKTMGIQKNERFNSYSHFIGFVAGILVTIIYFVLSIPVDIFLAISVTITGFTYVLLFASSFLHHANKADESEESIWLKLDHASIFIMMAGSYVGPLYIFAQGGIRWGVLAAVWIFAVIGIILKLKYLLTPNWINVLIYAPLSVIAFVPMYILWHSVDFIPPHLVPIPLMKSMLVGGFVLYGIGGSIYALKRPDPKPDMVGFHGIFHLCVLAGAGLHATALYYSIRAYPLIKEYLL
jgi:hemolysin III